ncbi:putative phospholipid-transporting ATPase DNF3 [Cytospora mali]|uniref:Phospholipid-transporting ATPase n=1 Tax=Cytospora mali TaxID=578113 RepID=A0A194UMF3_CYTMA|nr:putative phospholipid-transporting ATPase DNF3 [Valsa mali var. pyri (nom. inval.)]
MAARGPDRRSTSIDILRSELENIEEAEILVPPRSNSRNLSPRKCESAQPIRDIGEGRVSGSRRRSSSSRRSEGGGHIRFSGDIRHRERHRGHETPHLRLDTNLYPIQSSVDDTEAARQWRESREQNAIAGAYVPPSGRGRRLEGEELRTSRVSFAEPTVITSRPRHRHLRLGGLQGNVKSVANAAEASATISRAKDWVVRQRARTNRLKRVPTGRIKTRLAEVYKWILKGLLRQKPLPPSTDGRHIPLKPGLARREDFTDQRTGKPFISNFIRSSRYTVWSFLPKQLFFQFSKLANAYFLTIGILQMIPGLSTTGTYTTIGPLIAFVALSMAKEGWDDYRRYKLDKLENRTEAWVLDPARSVSAEKRHGTLREKFWRREDVGGEIQELDEVAERDDGNTSWSQDEEAHWSKARWEQLRVGDIIRLRRDENIPADIILLHATGPNGIAYIETMALDGETNLKSKQACPVFAQHCRSLSELQACEAEIVSEDPNLDLYNYDGKAIVNGEAMPLTLNQVVYRGSILRNTNEAIGVVVNTGEECKIRMNASKNVHAKAPAMQSKVNKIVILLVFFVILLSVGCSIGNIIWVNDYQSNAWYLNNYVVSFGEILIGFVIAFNTLIPLSLYVSLEIVKIGQVMLLRDIDMYDPKTDTPMVANTTTILEDLGQVSYVFSDKTGTLTENLMRFRKMSVAGTAWLHDMDVRREAEANKRKHTGVEVSGAKYAKVNEKQAARVSMSTTISEPTKDPLITEPGSNVCPPGRPSSVWTSTARPSQAQPQLNTESLIQYIRQKPNSPFSKKARQFILCIALCHTCLPEKKAGGEIEFQAASPDELALVEAAQDLGFLVIDRPSQSIKLQFTNELGILTIEQYGILDVIEFSSKRKRMSIVIRMPDGRICVFIKGADSVIMPLLKLNKLALETACAVDRKASIRKSMEQEKALRRLSMHSVRNSTSVARAASSIFGRKSTAKRSASMQRQRSSVVMDEIDSWITAREREPSGNEASYQSPRTPTARGQSFELLASPEPMDDPYDGMVDESIALSESAVFERCFQHIDDFASEGLRTLLFAYRYVSDDEYNKWKSVYHEAATSLVDRQERIEAAAELIEQSFDLAGATAIEDKLQQDVPETIDKLRRANIKVWMLTGDKRETAINIAHSARICKPCSEIYILDVTEGDLQEKLAATLVEVGRGMIPHSVVVIDGHTLGVVEDDESLKVLLFDLVARVDSVICCRASPAQKATLVKCIRTHVPSSLTLAIGDGANDIAMIQASHVGIGISGREGLQAARISDYSIAQFGFLQKLLFVHGRWNNIRTGKYILGTFWKEIVFYLVQALYQKYNGYTGTSLYESASLAVFNTLFTSLAVILVGIFEQDLRAETLLAVPELYTYGQKNKAFNFKKYIGWMVVAVIEAVLIFYGIWGIFVHIPFTGDNTLFAMGDLAFTVCVVFINVKMLVLELHNKTLVTFIGFLISVAGWFIWNLFLSAIYKAQVGPYTVRDGMTNNFGRTPTWWLTVVMALAVVILFELSLSAVRRIFWPQDQDLMQEVERYAGVLDVMREHAAEMGEAGIDNRKISRDSYAVPPPFAPTPEESMTTHVSEVVSLDGETMLGALPPEATVVQSPIEMQSSSGMASHDL